MQESGIIFKGPVSGVNIAQGSVQHQTANVYGYSNTEVLSALEAILKNSEIPWTSRELTAARAAITRAVQNRDTTDPQLRPAVSKIIDVCQNLGLGVLGNALFDVLKGFVT